MKRALITGITGQDGSHLADLLLAKGYEVHGIVRRQSSPNHWRIAHVIDRLHLHDGDLLDGGSLTRIVRQVRPDEVYNLAAQSFVGVSFEQPEYTSDVVGLGTIRLLEAVRQAGKDARFYQASSSEMFGSAPAPQSELTPFHPRSPYGVAKCFAHMAAVNYREAYGMAVSCGILFNHEGERRGPEFVTRKITRGVAAVKRGQLERIPLGNLDAKRDWGYAGEYVEAMWLMLHPAAPPGDYVIATGKTHSIQEFLALAFARIGRDWRNHVVIDPRFVRPAEVDELRGDATKAERLLGWKARIGLPTLVDRMVDADLARP